APQQTTSTASSGAAEIPKDEVGWYFVEQYYTTLSRSPEKLYLFYNKRSQFVSGVEEEKVSVCVGQKAIDSRIKELDFQDCKVRVTNVDSQGSDSNIVIQVIGEISNKSAPHRKFAQTFVLAGQTNGYFVLNDIFRYIQEEEEIVEEELQQDTNAIPEGYVEPAPTAVEHQDQAGAHETVVAEEDVAQVDKELEAIEQEEKKEVSPPPAQVNGTPVPEKAEVVHADEAPAAAVGGTEEASSPETVEPAATEEVAEPEKPQEPEPTPAAAPKASPAPPAAPAAPAKPAAPMSWAMKAASAHRAVAPAVPAVAPQAPTQPKAATPAQSKPIAAPTAPAAAASTTGSASPADTQQDGWQTAGAEHNKRQSRAQNQPIADVSNGVRAYIKNVFEHTDPDALKAELSKFDTIKYFDINRPKNAAFVEFATQEGFQAAVAANPHQIGSDSIIVEERRQSNNNFRGGYAGRGGSMNGRGRGGADGRPGQGRGGFKQDGGRGGFAPRGRGGSGTPRRGGATA
ncbi:hypothetical protein K490DRAFT_21836, partial [Saccharata proteae CBS 121410]